MSYIPENITSNTIITSEWGNKIEQELAKLGNYMGIVQTQSDLPSSPVKGDYYLVEDQAKFYIWNGTEWNSIGGSIIISQDTPSSSGVTNGTLWYQPFNATDNTGPQLRVMFGGVWTDIGNTDNTSNSVVLRDSNGEIYAKKYNATDDPGFIGNVSGSATKANYVEWTDVGNKPSTFPPSQHTQGWDTITGKPATYPPSPHTHTSQQITDATSANTADKIVKRDQSGNFSQGTVTVDTLNATTINGTLNGNASSATTATTATTADNANKIQGHRLFVQSTQPSNPEDGDLWVVT